MKKQATVELYFCDFCSKDKGDSFAHSCFGCGKHFCFQCQMNSDVCVEYHRGVWSGGTGDGRYCAACNSRLLASGTDPLFNAYLRVAALREENETFYDGFKKLADAAEKKVVRLYESFRSSREVME